MFVLYCPVVAIGGINNVEIEDEISLIILLPFFLHPHIATLVNFFFIWTETGTGSGMLRQRYQFQTQMTLTWPPSRLLATEKKIGSVFLMCSILFQSKERMMMWGNVSSQEQKPICWATFFFIESKHYSLKHLPWCLIIRGFKQQSANTMKSLVKIDWRWFHLK